MDHRDRTRRMRGLADIRTLTGGSGRGGGGRPAHARLCALAMELERREQEHRAASARAEVALRRARAIERDIASILSELGERVGERVGERESAPAAAGSVRIRYGAGRRALGAITNRDEPGKETS